MSGPVAFCIGLNRTGTTTFGDACQLLGFTRLGWVRTRQRFESHFLLKAWEHGDFDHLAQVASGYQVLEDLPWPLVYREMAGAFPEAKFALTRRASVDVWLQSQATHIRGYYGMHHKIYGSASPVEDPEAYRAFYERHLRDVRAFFAGTDRLTELCWEDGDAWPQLCGLLGVPVPDVPFPHSNPAGTEPPPPPPPPWTLRRVVRKVSRATGLSKGGGRRTLPQKGIPGRA